MYWIWVFSSWPTAGFCSDMVATESSTSPPLFWAQILLLLSRQQRKVLTPLPHGCFLHVWCLPRPILDYCNALCTCFDVITMCHLLPGWTLIEQWPNGCKHVRRQQVSNVFRSMFKWLMEIGFFVSCLLDGLSRIQHGTIALLFINLHENIKDKCLKYQNAAISELIKMRKLYRKQHQQPCHLSECMDWAI